MACAERTPRRDGERARASGPGRVRSRSSGELGRTGLRGRLCGRRPQEPDPGNAGGGRPATMTTAAERLERALEREAPTWGIRPVPPEQRRLGGFDFAVLWGDLS